MPDIYEKHSLTLRNIRDELRAIYESKYHRRLH